jgi:NAD(P)H dehydrogenase (quinone)
MPKTLIIYDSKSGSTEKMAKAVEEGVRIIKGVDVNVYKVGTRFPMSMLNQTDAIILGSPSEYGTVTSEMRSFIDSAVELKNAKKLLLNGKLGGAFGSYGWDGGWATEVLEEIMKNLGLNVIEPIISAADHMGAMGVHIDEKALQKCRDLGKTIAQKLVKA